MRAPYSGEDGGAADALFDQPVVGIVGGLHYGMAGESELRPQTDFLHQRAVQNVALSPHDSGPQAIQAFRAAFPDAYPEIQVGREIRYP